jgi:hypothetical protein
MTTTRTQDEILARFHAIADGDFFGFRREVLSDAMTADTLKAAMPGANVVDTWTPDDTEPAARGYLDFAIGKILNHRGISAARSVDKLGEYAWLLGRDDVVSAMDAAGYEQYGAPKVKAFAEGMGWEWPDDRELVRMADGLPCRDGCEGGCGL